MDKEVIVCDHQWQAAEYMKRVNLQRHQCIVATQVEHLHGLEFESCAMLTTNQNLIRMARSRMGRKALS